MLPKLLNCGSWNKKHKKYGPRSNLGFRNAGLDYSFSFFCHFRFLKSMITNESSLIGRRLQAMSDMNESEIEEDVLLERRRVTVGQRRDVTLDGDQKSNVLEIVGLTKTFNSLARRTKVVAVDDVTLGIHRGEVF